MVVKTENPEKSYDVEDASYSTISCLTLTFMSPAVFLASVVLFAITLMALSWRASRWHAVLLATATLFSLASLVLAIVQPTTEHFILATMLWLTQAALAWRACQILRATNPESTRFELVVFSALQVCFLVPLACLWLGFFRPA